MQQLSKTTKKAARKTVKNEAETKKFTEVIRKLEKGLDLGNRYSTASCCGITLAQCHLLLEIESNQGASLNAVSASTGLDKSTLSRTLDALIKNGYADRRNSLTDRRSIELFLTEKGFEKIKEINSITESFYGLVLEKLKAAVSGNPVEVMNILSDILIETGLCRECNGNTKNSN